MRPPPPSPPRAPLAQPTAFETAQPRPFATPRAGAPADARARAPPRSLARGAPADAHALDLAPHAADGSSLFSVFDGHGGDAVALFAAGRLHAAVRAALGEGHPPEAAFASAYASVDAAAAAADIADYTGCTVVTALVSRAPAEGGGGGGGDPAAAADAPGRTLVACANAGDARALLVLLPPPPPAGPSGGGGGGAPAPAGAAPPAAPTGGHVALSTDHTPELPAERVRIAAVGGVVARGRVCGVLAVSRALGDARLQPAVTAAPSTARALLEPGQRAALLLFCDGVSCVMDDGCVAGFVAGAAGAQARAGVRPGDAAATALAQQLVTEALLRGSRDNVTAVCVLL